MSTREPVPTSSTPSHLVRGLLARVRRARQDGHLAVPRGSRLLVGLDAAVAVLALLVLLAPEVVPFSTLMVPLLVGSLLLRPRQTPWFVAVVLAALAVALVAQEELTARVVGAAGIQVLMCGIVLATSTRRQRLGVGAGAGESMFVDLRDRILAQGRIPELPAGWHAESALRSADGTAFAGDFVVASRTSTDHLEVAVVDVSGKGDQAGTRALLLSGAFGALVGAVPPAGFLAAANDYLLAQEWEEGFATAVHLSLDLATGRYEVRSAGHPPPVVRHAGSGRWSVLSTEGPFLGLVADPDHPATTGTLGPGDALVLYTDGLVEEPRRDIDLGIDRLLGEAERLLRGRFVGSAATLVDALGSSADDRALVVVHRG